MHGDQRAYDAARAAAIEILGIRVVRIKNEDILDDMQSVIAWIVSIAD